MLRVFSLICLVGSLLGVLPTHFVKSEDSVLLANAVRNIAVGSREVVVATETCLCQFDNMLHLQSCVHAGNRSNTTCISNPTPPEVKENPPYNMLLLLYNDSILSCWTADDGSCYERKLNDLGTVLGLKIVRLFNLTCDGEMQQGKILASFPFMKSGGYFWAGIFTTDSKARGPKKTALCIYNVTAMEPEKDPCKGNMANEVREIRPINLKPSLSQSSLTAVFGIEVQHTMVFFLGTEDGQVLKVTLDSEWKASCPEILYQFKEESQVFHTIKADPINSNYIYVASKNEIVRIKVAYCERFVSYKECLSAEDPLCRWCHSQKRCTLNTECEPSGNVSYWNNITDEGGISLEVLPIGDKKINITAKVNTSTKTQWQCVFRNNATNKELCNGPMAKLTMACSCEISTVDFSYNDCIVIELSNGNRQLSDIFHFKKCHQSQSCTQCKVSGCLWCPEDATCTSYLTLCKENSHQGRNGFIKSISPENISQLGKRMVSITGENLLNLSRLALFGASSCLPQNIKIIKITNNTHAVMSLPKSNKEVKIVCFNFTENKCHQGVYVNYLSMPSCVDIFPNTSWYRGGRNITIVGKNLDLMDYLTMSDRMLQNYTIKCTGNTSQCTFQAPQVTVPDQNLNLKIKVEDVFFLCRNLIYKENPFFTSFAVLKDVDSKLEIRIKKTNDDLIIQEQEIKVQIIYLNKTSECLVQNITQNMEDSTVFCKAGETFADKIDVSKIKVKVTLGDFTTTLDAPNATYMYYLLVLLVIPLLAVVIGAYLMSKHKSKQMSEKLSEQLERLECDVIEEIRNGFAELQMEKLDLALESVTTIPFLDYKHFALKTLFPEMEESKVDFTEKLFENVPSPFHSRSSPDENEHLFILRQVFENKRFLVSLIHTLEHQNNFSIKDRCMFASLLTISFQSNLIYLTELLEDLIKDLMDQTANKHPKLMLRRTESVAEKLLTNWMSTCMYGFLRESVGEPLYLLVHMLNQRIHKGPIDAITSKALYTLNENSLLWQMNSEFNTVELDVYFPKSYTEDEENLECIKVTGLDCDAIGQLKEKVLQTFLNRKGYSWGIPLADTGLVLLHGQSETQLFNIDKSSVVLENGIKKLNTLKHYKVENGSTIKVTIKKDCDLQDVETSNKCCHLILPTSDVEESEGKQKKGEHKFKVKELYLTKLLSTKVALQSPVERLFRSIWNVPSNKPPIAVKHFFDFLDTQAEYKKITDQDVLHIWKTNSLPLRFWVNILKNPQFVFDIQKTPLLESCLSVIAQAFMDSFSLSEEQLGKSSPTNKLLYAKDIPTFKEEVNNYYRAIREAHPVSSLEMREFLIVESQKHENEFKEYVALQELYKYIAKYFNHVMSMIEKESGFEEVQKQLLHIKELSDNKKKCMWE
ncbi:hypothetical protein GDO86_005681 [Hymenochirus boettgeri]|uniref:PSI domain-containing protein n=1 Tax=Hymenochirus boettgeri TaxID=247094 RepID=A0A8T2J846_9PIPI|nr:hypothetical protein GDO86_005681 [Hymenochirus boettgeri]